MSVVLPYGGRSEFFLASLPYPFGPQREVDTLPDGHLDVLGQLPIPSGVVRFGGRQTALLLAPDFTGLFVIYGAILSVPVLLAAAAAVLASSAGAQAAVQLPRGRHVLATVIGIFACCLCLGGAPLAPRCFSPTFCPVPLS